MMILLHQFWFWMQKLYSPISMLQQESSKGGKEKVNSVGTSKTFAYVDAARRATYTGEAHITGPQGDLTSPRVELFLKPSGDELERAEKELEKITHDHVEHIDRAVQRKEQELLEV